MLVTEQVDPGGKRSHVVALRAGLEAIGWKAELFDSSGLTPLERIVLAAPTRLLDMGRAGLGHRWLVPELRRSFERHLRSLARTRDIALWHVQEPLTWLAAKRASDRTPIAVTVHGPIHREIASGYGLPLEDRTVQWIREVERRAYLGADAVISVDRAHADYVRAFGRTSGVWVVPNFVDTRCFHPGVDPRPFPGDVERFVGARPVVFCPRRLVPKNGVDVAIRAVARLGRRGVPCVLVVAGDGPQHGELTALVGRLDAGPVVRFLGGVPPERMPGWHRRADVVIVPSIPHKGIREATSISVLEAQACGRPVVASAVGGLLEIVSDGVDGRLVPPGDDEGLAEVIASLLADPEARDRLGGAAAARVRAEHSHLVGARSYAAIYRALGVDLEAAGGERAGPGGE